MYSKTAEKQQHSRKNIHIPSTLIQSRQKILLKHMKVDRNQSMENGYGTDSKRLNKQNSINMSWTGDVEEMRAVIQSCQSCMERISQFTTKKPKQNKKDCGGKSMVSEEKGTQTVNKPFLIDLIQERVDELCRQNRRLSKIMLQKQAQILDRDNQMSEMEQKFTNILYTLGQELSQLRILKSDYSEIKFASAPSTETPAYLKALMMEESL